MIDVTLVVKPQVATPSQGTNKQQQANAKSHGSHAPPVTTEMVHTTENHPWLTIKGWITAGRLHLGDQVQQLNGNAATIVALKTILGSEDMYDLTVSNVHTFAVGNQQFVVHNVNRPCVIGTYSQVRGLIGRTPSLTGQQSHHILQDASMKVLPGYSYGGAPAIALYGGSAIPGSEHFLANEVQNNAAKAFRASGRTLLALSDVEDVAKRALIAAGYTPGEAATIVSQASNYFTSRFSPALLNSLRVPK